MLLLLCLSLSTSFFPPFQITDRKCLVRQHPYESARVFSAADVTGHSAATNTPDLSVHSHLRSVEEQRVRSWNCEVPKALKEPKLCVVLKVCHCVSK